MGLRFFAPGYQRNRLGAVPARRCRESDMAQDHRGGKCVELFLHAALGALGWLFLGDQPVVGAELFTFAEVHLARAVEPHEGVNAGLRQVPEGVERAKPAVRHGRYRLSSGWP